MSSGAGHRAALARGEGDDVILRVDDNRFLRLILEELEPQQFEATSGRRNGQSGRGDAQGANTRYPTRALQ